jgi:putative membrane protein
MEAFHQIVLTLHIVFFSVWIGNLFAIAFTLVFRNDQTDAAIRKTLGTLTRKKGRAADVGAALTILSGACLIGIAPAFFLHRPWLHIKLTLVVVMLGVHGFLRMRAKKAEAGDTAKFPRALMGVMSLIAAAIVAMVIFRPFH